jgi:hypothetical protein
MSDRKSANMRRLIEEYGYHYVADFAAIAQGGSQSQAVKIDAGGDFVVEALHLGVYFSSTVNLTTSAAISALAAMNGYMAKLTRRPSPTGGLNTNGHLGHTKLYIKTNDRPWMNQPVRSDLITGEPGILYFLQHPIRVKGNQTINIDLYNNLPATIGGAAAAPIDAQLLFLGVRQRTS